MKEKNNHIDLNIMLFFVLLALKLFGVISWSWWIVTFPIWIPFISMFIVGIWVLVLWLINNYK
jgi:hypothetical protein